MSSFGMDGSYLEKPIVVRLTAATTIPSYKLAVEVVVVDSTLRLEIIRGIVLLQVGR